jgi:hypothetical protein
MAKQKYYLVHANLAQLQTPLDNPVMVRLTKRQDEIDSLAERMPGFVSQPELSDAGKVYNSEMLLNVSIWEEVELLERFVNNPKHAALLARPEEWLVDDEYPPYVLFWAPAEVKLTEREIKERFELLDQNGPSTVAFTIERRFTVLAMLTAGLKRIPRISMT